VFFVAWVTKNIFSKLYVSYDGERWVHDINCNE